MQEYEQIQQLYLSERSLPIRCSGRRDVALQDTFAFGFINFLLQKSKEEID